MQDLQQENNKNEVFGITSLQSIATAPPVTFVIQINTILFHSIFVLDLFKNPSNKSFQIGELNPILYFI